MKTFDEMRQEIGDFLKTNEGGRLWDLMCALRGPDTPSERPNMGSAESSAAYAGRRKRKRNSTEMIREAAFFGVIGGCARHRAGDTIYLPPSNEWDHFDKHMQRAAAVLGLKVVERGEKEEGTAVTIKPASVKKTSPLTGIGSLSYYQTKLLHAQEELKNATKSFQVHYWTQVVKNYLGKIEALQKAEATYSPASVAAALGEVDEITESDAEPEDNDDY